MISIEQSAYAQSPAAAGLDLSSEVIVRIPCDHVAMYIGTRAALESEGLVPAHTEWPRGFCELRWQAGGAKFQIRRRRPEGIKGPRRDFLAFDWWEVRVEPAKMPDYRTFDVVQKTKALNDAIYAHSLAGRAEARLWSQRLLDASMDHAYQAFKTLIPGLVKSHSAARA
ncbi:hypothetical protein [Zoogloea sp.]|uniref:hypothetical protein n=1 Tax=Zoogloea sp. TaxID=49181 RepID=UPI0014158BE8|nr:MAG: hypothetical protein F9K15_22795 [Zoogloea sp.]